VVHDSVAKLLIPLPTAFVLGKIKGVNRIHLAMRVSSTANVGVRVESANLVGGISGHVNFRAATALDTPAARDTGTYQLNPHSVSPRAVNAYQPDLADYTITLSGNTAASPLIEVGGLTAARAYLRFVVPAGIVESTTVVRATLMLHQVAYTGPGGDDTLFVVPRIVLAAPLVEPGPSAQLLDFASAVPFKGLVPSKSGDAEFEVINFVRRFRVDKPLKQQRALVLEALGEGLQPQVLYFSSNESLIASQRPRLRLSYIPRVRFGLP
nr:hypothetical protein [Candidatus Eremiobacteraeota bacterium]